MLPTSLGSSSEKENNLPSHPQPRNSFSCCTWVGAWGEKGESATLPGTVSGLRAWGNLVGDWIFPNEGKKNWFSSV